MTKFFVIAVAGVMSFVARIDAADKVEKVPPALNFTMKTIDGKPVELSKYAGKVILIVNVASQCGLTDQYEELQLLHEVLGKRGLVVLGVPCNQFGGQEPGSNAEIKKFCKQNYDVTFDMLAKVDVNGEKACGLYKVLTSAKTKPVGPGKVGWNFEKFLLDRKGNVVGRFDANTSPTDEQMLMAIKKALTE